MRILALLKEIVQMKEMKHMYIMNHNSVLLLLLLTIKIFFIYTGIYAAVVCRYYLLLLFILRCCLCLTRRIRWFPSYSGCMTHDESGLNALAHRPQTLTFDPCKGCE